jgi:hypothetical protein
MHALFKARDAHCDLEPEVATILSVAGELSVELFF